MYIERFIQDPLNETFHFKFSYIDYYPIVIFKRDSIKTREILHITTLLCGP